MGTDMGTKNHEEFNQHAASVSCGLECLLGMTSSKHRASGHLSKAESHCSGSTGWSLPTQTILWFCDGLCQHIRHWM